MALYFDDVNGRLIIPSAPASWEVKPSSAGTSTTGVLVLVGEAAAGPDFTQEDVVSSGGYGVNSKAAVQAKYGSGRLADAYAMACAPSKDASVKGAPTRIYLLKTNQGTKALAALTGSYSTIRAKSAGTDGNLVNVNITTPAANTRLIQINRASDNISQSYTIGNNVVLNIGAQTASAVSMTISATTLTSAGIPAVAASGTATLTSVVAGDKLTINSVDFTAVTSPTVPGPNQFLTGSDNETAENLADAVNDSVSVGVAGVVTADALLKVVTVTAVVAGTAGNSVTFTKTGSTVVLSPLTGVLAGGVNEIIAPLSITLASYRTISDLVAFIGTKTGWVVSAVTMFRQNSPSVLDQGTTVVNDVGGATVGIKKDAYEFVSAVNSSQLVEVSVAPTTGLPTNQTLFLAGGLRGASTDTTFVNALVQAERLMGNFVVTLVSQDATADTDTDAGSSYTAAGVNAALAAHVAKCSQFKKMRPRQGFASFSGTFANQKLAAQTMGSARISMAFLNVLVAGASGSLAWFQPWAEAVIAASMQAACTYKPIFNKSLNIFGVLSPEGDFTVENSDQVEDALMNGLLCVAPRDADGAIAFVSDQTTYGVDNNFVFNSISAIYNSDVVSQTISQKMQLAFVGQSFADISAGVAMTFLKSVFGQLKRNKWLSASDDAPGGYKNATISISAPSMLVSAEVKTSTGIYFIPIHLLVSETTSSASA